MVLEFLELAMKLGLLSCPGAYRLEPLLCRGGSGGGGGVNDGLSLGQPKMVGSMDNTCSDETLDCLSN